MLRFLIISIVWMGVSFALLWWVQVSIDRMHRSAVEVLGAQIVTEPINGDATGAALFSELARVRLSGARAIEAMNADRRELLRRLRTMWIVSTLAPLLIGAWWMARSAESQRDVEEDGQINRTMVSSRTTENP